MLSSNRIDPEVQTTKMGSDRFKTQYLKKLITKPSMRNTQNTVSNEVS